MSQEDQSRDAQEPAQVRTKAEAARRVERQIPRRHAPRWRIATQVRRSTSWPKIVALLPVDLESPDVEEAGDKKKKGGGGGGKKGGGGGKTPRGGGGGGEKIPRKDADQDRQRDAHHERRVGKGQGQEGEREVGDTAPSRRLRRFLSSLSARNLTLSPFPHFASRSGIGEQARMAKEIGKNRRRRAVGAKERVRPRVYSVRRRRE